jgi:hypothetical protein
VFQKVNSKPLPFDVDVLKDINVSLKGIQAAYQLLDDFWVTELVNLSRVIETAHVDRTRAERWLGYKDALEETISNWKVSAFCTSPLLSGLIVGCKIAGAATNDGIKDAEMDADTEIHTVRALASLHPSVRLLIWGCCRIRILLRSRNNLVRR